MGAPSCWRYLSFFSQTVQVVLESYRHTNLDGLSQQKSPLFQGELCLPEGLLPRLVGRVSALGLHPGDFGLDPPRLARLGTKYLTFNSGLPPPIMKVFYFFF